MNKYKPFSLAAILALIFTLSACAEQILETAADDPEPEITSGETSYVTSQVLAQNSSTDERLPQPNDITRGSYNNSDTNTSNDVGPLSSSMPIRIPFNGTVPALYTASGDVNTTVADAYKKNIYIWAVASGTYAALGKEIVPLPYYDSDGDNTNDGGDFKYIYQDSNKDLVFLPAPGQFDSNKTYFVVVNKNLNGTNGQAIIPDTLTQLLTATTRLISEDNSTIYSELLKDVSNNGVDEDSDDKNTTASLEAVRTLYVGTDGSGGMVAALAAGQLGTTQHANFSGRNDIASISHFSTEDLGISAGTSTSDSTKPTNDQNTNGIGDTTEGAISSAFGILAANVAGENINWLSSESNMTTLTGDISNNGNLKSTMLQAGYLGTDFNLSAVNGLYKGFFTCYNFLVDSGEDNTTGATKWELSSFSKLANGTTNVSAYQDCPNALTSVSSELNGTIGFWLAVPDAPAGAFIFMHGIGGHKDQFFYLANRLASFGYSSLAIDIWGHGERTYEEGTDTDKVLENNMSSKYDDSGDWFVRPDNPSLTVGYILQTVFDIYRLGQYAINNTEINSAIRSGVTLDLSTGNIFNYVGLSLGGIIGSVGYSLSSNASQPYPFYRYVYNVTGGDLTDIVMNGSLGSDLRASVAASRGYDTTTVRGQQELAKAMVALDLLTSHALFSTGTDPLSLASSHSPTRVLLQEVVGDKVVPNSNSELLAKTMGLTNKSDGDALVNDSSNNAQIRWTLNPANYSILTGESNTSHSFLIDFNTTATDQAQKQLGCYFKFGHIPNPAATITVTDNGCTN